ncbi:MAG: fumarylacetoacetate hydrolase family protein [Burkholderiales bacterium]|nr:fumarylacetoacetate hydrolase family protein [Burkholderiales bacterium]
MRERLVGGRSLPQDAADALLVGRVHLPEVDGPAVCAVRDGGVWDISRVAPTMSALLEFEHPARTVAGARDLPFVGALDDVLANTPAGTRDASRPWLLAPCDLQAVKAAGVTFVASMLERVIEEQARGDPGRAQEVRRAIAGILGDDLASVRPGSPEALRVKEVLLERNAWSQYLEVGIGPDAEIFTKAQPMSSVGTGAAIGIHPKSAWNNPEPEIVLFVSSRGAIGGASLGNDVNLRDVEGRSALLLGKAKDNNASCAIGPFVRLFDARFTLDDVRGAEIRLRVDGDDGFVLQGASSMARISRDPLDLVGQAIGPNHQYPDGFVLFCGTMFAPVQDRHGPGQGFTHEIGDVVTIATPRLGALVNRVDRTDAIAPWTFGTGALMRNLARRGLLRA